jgi:regulator of cell morphogenesis and NO signaling
MSQPGVSSSVAEWASQGVRAALLLERASIDIHQAASLPLEVACQASGGDVAALRGALERACAPRVPEERDWQAASLRELIRHIVAYHHEYLKLELPLLRRRLERLAEGHGNGESGLLKRLAAAYAELHEELDLHMHKEAQILFPFIEAYEGAAERGEPVLPPPFGTVSHPVGVMEREHERALAAVALLRHIAGGYKLPPAACCCLRSVFRSLEQFEADMQRHIQLENDILHPRAQQLEATLLGG